MRRESALGRRATRAHHRLGTCRFPSSRDAHHDDDDDTWVPRSHRQWWTGVSPSNSCLRGTVWRLKKTNYVRKPGGKAPSMAGTRVCTSSYLFEIALGAASERSCCRWCWRESRRPGRSVSPDFEGPPTPPLGGSNSRATASGSPFFTVTVGESSYVWKYRGPLSESRMRPRGQDHLL